MDKMILIDGTSMLMTAYYGSAPLRSDGETDEEYYKKLLQTSTGVYTNAVSVMLKTILGLIGKCTPNYMAVAFDSGRENTFRAKMYSEYKGTRGAVPEPIKQQIKTMENILKQLGIPVFSKIGYEADDIVCSLVYKYKSPNREIALISKDHDYYQLVDDENHVILWQPQNTVEKAAQLNTKIGWKPEQLTLIPKKYVVLDEVGVISMSGVRPEQIPDLKALSGDKSDNIPGVPGIGEKSAINLLRLYESIEGIYAALFADEKAFLDVCKYEKIRNPIKALSENTELGFMSLSLATMSKSAADDIKLENLKLPDRNKLNSGVVEVSEKYEMKTLLNYL